MRTWILVVAAALVTLTVPAAQADDDERTGLHRRGDTQYTLVGPAVGVGSKAPKITARDPKTGDVVTVDPADGRVRVVYVLPSIDTATCSLSTRQFNSKAADLDERVEVVVVSRDLPAAWNRSCETHGIDQVRPLSDYESGAFGKSWGLYIKETGLLARSVSVVDSTGTVTYQEIVPDQPDEPNYTAALDAVAAILAKMKP